ncbi:MAG: glutamate--tRNA ligase [Ignavibacteria bacterium]|nr:glutamate--tRNA ligase [Ignavibacteria bacterium]MBI3764905.1 glutamate--tRNA ligase [Ignavibacteriales bacterium]
MSKFKTIRVRFAPSPTGYLHVGGLRTALYNFLFARKHGGVFILRIEDTDRTRYVNDAVDNLIETLRWAGLDYDEGPEKGGTLGPYVQSQRLEIYKQHVDRLLNTRTAYRCFCTPDRLEMMRKEQEARHISPKYDRNCLSLSQQEIQENARKGIPCVVRMKIPDSLTIRFHDVIRDDVEFSSEMLDDQVLMKSDGYPTYHLANVVDDHLMQISHVIRGEEWLSSTPKHVLLYQFFGWELPEFAHLPLLLNPDRSKLSKRQGDVAVEDYRAKGYLKEALVNFVAMLGWNPGTEQEYFSLEELIQQFSLERVNKAGAIFNIEKLNWLNAEHLRRKPDEELLRMLKEALAQSNFKNAKHDDEYLLKVIFAMRERVSFVNDFIEKGSYFFEPPNEYDQEVVRKRWKAETPSQLKQLAEEFSKLTSPTKQDYEAALQNTADVFHVGNGTLIHAVRLAVSGVGGGPGVYDILFILGKDESLKRMHTAIERLT